MLTTTTWRELREQEDTRTLYVMSVGDTTAPEGEQHTQMETANFVMWNQLEYMELLQEEPNPARRAGWQRRLRDDFMENGRIRPTSKGGRCMSDRVADMICEAASEQRRMVSNFPAGTVFIRLRAICPDSEWRRVGDIVLVASTRITPEGLYVMARDAWRDHMFVRTTVRHV